MQVILEFLSGLLAPILVKFVNDVLGLKGVPALWVLYAICVLISIVFNLINNSIDFTNVTSSVAIISATAQTVFHLIVKNANDSRSKPKD